MEILLLYRTNLILERVFQIKQNIIFMIPKLQGEVLSTTLN